MIDVSESERQDVVDVSETEQKESDSQDETQFGVIWEKFVPGVDAKIETYSDTVWCGLEEPTIVADSGKGTPPCFIRGPPLERHVPPLSCFCP